MGEALEDELNWEISENRGNRPGIAFHFKPIFSIVIATLNPYDRIRTSIESVISQTLNQWELIIIDGGSQHSALKAVEDYRQYIKVFISERDDGIYDAWNKALKFVTGKWVLFLGDDDELADHDVLAKLAENRFISSDLPILYGRIAFVDDKGTRLAEFGRPWNEVKGLMSERMALPHQAVLHNAEYLKVGKFDNKYRYAGDYDMVLKLLNHGAPLFIDLEIAHWRAGGITSSPLNQYKVIQEMRQIQKSHGIKTNLNSLLIRACLKKLIYTTVGPNRYNRLIAIVKTLKS